MKASPRQQRIQRAEELIGQHAFAAEILGFYIQVARFQEESHRRLAQVLQSATLQSANAEFDRDLGTAELAEFIPRFDSFLALAESRGPAHLTQISRELRESGETAWRDLLRSSWLGHSASDARQLLAAAFLQPYAELLRTRAQRQPLPQTYAVCPACHRKPGFGVLRQMGEGAARSLVCGFCLEEWDFRRIVCPGCGEEDERKLAVFSAGEFDHIRVECCDTCKTYIKTIDLTKDGRAEPLVDELASAPLDLWAAGRGYAKLKKNVLGM